MGTSGAENPPRQKNESEAPKSPVKKNAIGDVVDQPEIPEPQDMTGQDSPSSQLGQHDATPTEARAAGTDVSHSPEAIEPGGNHGDASQGGGFTVPKTKNTLHGRLPSLSVQSKMRSDSFRRTSTTGPLSPSANFGGISTLTPDSEQMSEIYRKQAMRVEELERENKRLEKEAREGEVRWRRSEEELEELREASGEASALKAQAKMAAEADAEISLLKAEVAALQRQAQQRSHSRSMSKQMRSSSGLNSGDSTGSPDSVKRELESKDSTIAEMELEIGRLRGELSSKTSNCDAHGSQISALQNSLMTAEERLKQVERELSDSKQALSRASEKAVREGVERTSSDTKTRALERDLAEAAAARDEARKTVEKAEKKIEAMTKLHKEAEARHASKLAAAEVQAREAAVLKARLVAVENENRRMREERDGRKRREASGGGGR